MTYSFNDLLNVATGRVWEAHRALHTHGYQVSRLPRQVPQLLAAMADVADRTCDEQLKITIRSLGRDWWMLEA